jgi:phosphate butyryltransferase
MYENKTYDELSVGDEATIKRVCTGNDLYVFAHASGNLNPLHLPGTQVDEPPEAVAPSMWIGALISAVLGNVLPGPGTLYHAQNLTFANRVAEGDELTISVKVVEKLDQNLVRLDTRVLGAGGVPVAEGVAEVYAPTHKMRYEGEDVPSVEVRRYGHFEALMARCEGLRPMRTVVVAPEDEASLGGALLAAAHGLIQPLLIGSEARIRSVAQAAGFDLSGAEIRDVGEPAEAADQAAAMASRREVDALMKGALHTDELLRPLFNKTYALRTSRRISHAFVFDTPGLDHMLFITDAAVNIAPTLEEKVDIVQNAIDLAIALGVKQPKVGGLSAVETVNPKIPSTLDAAILSKMAERGQIRGGVVDGPLAMDNAIDVRAARTKGINSLVSGCADILVVPNLEAGNMLSKELTFVAHAHIAGVVIGAKVPVILTSRADSEESRLASCAIAALYQASREPGAAAPVTATAPTRRLEHV